METQAPHLGSIIREQMHQKKISTVQLAQKIGVHPNNIRKMLYKQNIELNRLMQLSEALDHNLLAYLPQPKTTSVEQILPDEKDKQIADLQKENKRLNEENANLKLIVGLLQKK